MGLYSLEDARRDAETFFAPWVRDLAFEIEAVSADGVRARLPHDERLARADGVLCGQALMAFADTVMVFVVAAAGGEFRPMTTVNQTISFMRPTSGEDVVAEGRLLRLGRTMAFGDVVIAGAADPRPVAQITSTYALLRERA